MLQLNEIAKSNDAAVAIFDTLSKRMRHRDQMDLRAFYRDLTEKYGNLDQAEFLNVFKKLESMSYGSIVLGRGRKPNRFIWNYNLKDIAKAASGKLSPDEIEVKPKFTSKKTPAAPKLIPQGEVTKNSTSNLLILGTNGELERYTLTPEKEILLKNLLDQLVK